jgi:hypothetical protein
MVGVFPVAANAECVTHWCQLMWVCCWLASMLPVLPVAANAEHGACSANVRVCCPILPMLGVLPIAANVAHYY